LISRYFTKLRCALSDHGCSTYSPRLPGIYIITESQVSEFISDPFPKDLLPYLLLSALLNILVIHLQINPSCKYSSQHDYSTNPNTNIYSGRRYRFQHLTWNQSHKARINRHQAAQLRTLRHIRLLVRVASKDFCSFRIPSSSKHLRIFLANGYPRGIQHHCMIFQMKTLTDALELYTRMPPAHSVNSKSLMMVCTLIAIGVLPVS
jgi:hypothetical protein